MIVLGRHRPLVQDAWSETAVRTAIDEIAADAIAQFDPVRFWPAHPSDDGTGDGDPSFYKGAAGVIWALDYLHRVGATRLTTEFRPVLPKLLERTVADFAAGSPPDYEKHGSLLRAWAPPCSRCGWRPRRTSPTSCIAARPRTTDCRSGS
jgi:hypothetical protein